MPDPQSKNGTTATMAKDNFALITGASSGIGACFARALAARNRPLVLVARSKDKLEALASEIAAKHPLRIEVIEQDLSVEGAAQRHTGCAHTVLTRHVFEHLEGVGVAGNSGQKIG